MDFPDPEQALEVSAEFTKQALDSKSPPLLIDCREQPEFDHCRISGAILIPLSEFQERAPAMLNSTEGQVIVYCHHGVRSLHATQFLREHGYPNTFSMARGIDYWSITIDSSVKQY